MNKTTLNSQKDKHSMLSLRRATFIHHACHLTQNISIHALLAESDHCRILSVRRYCHFYPRSPQGERRIAERLHYILSLFLSTLSARRATQHGKTDPTDQHFYPRSPQGERRYQAGPEISNSIFLSTLSARRATIIASRYATGIDLFLSTLSLRRATCKE